MRSVDDELHVIGSRARIAMSREDWNGAATAWDALLRDFPGRAAPGWYAGLAICLRKTNQHERADRVLDGMAVRFPDAAESLVHLAEVAARRDDWGTALRLRSECIVRYSADRKPQWENGRAMAMFRLWRAAEAVAAWKGIIRDFPDFIPARVSLAGAFSELGDWAQVRQCYEELVARFPERVIPTWLVGIARSLMFTRTSQAALGVIAEINRRFPEDVEGCRFAVVYRNYLEIGLNVASAQLEADLERFPNDRQLKAEYVRVLLASGRPEDAQKLAQELEATGDDQIALISRWRVDIDLRGERSIRPQVERTVDGRAWTLADALPVANFLLSLWHIWVAECALRLLDGIADRYSGRINMVCARARALLALRRDVAARELIAAVPAEFQSTDVLELRAWAAMGRLEYESACQLSRQVMGRLSLPAVHSPEPCLELVTPDRAAPPSGVTAFFNIRNEMIHLPKFLRHHRGLGVTHFVCTDNMSTDGGAAYLRAQGDVTLYQTNDEFHSAGAGMRWVNALRERHGGGSWCLYVDADEFFIYPGWETLPLSRLTAYLDEHGAQGVAAFMLDVYPRRLIEDGNPAAHARYCYYDAGEDDYQWMGLVKPPYLQAVGGVRGRLFGAHEYLAKVPLLRGDAGIYTNPHNCTPCRFSPISGLLLHYKLLNLAARFRPPRPGIGGNPFMADRMPDLMRRHARYAARMECLMHAHLHQPGVSQELAHSLILADRGLMRAPAHFRQWLAEPH